MAVCALTLLDGMGDEAAAAGGVLLLAVALVLAWLSTHVADRGDHILGTILTVGAHASLIGLGGHDSYGGGSAGADAPEQQTAPPSQENKPDEGEAASDRGESEGTGEGAEGVWTDLMLDIQSKNPQTGRIHTSEDEEDEEEDDEDDDEEVEQKPVKTTSVLTTTATSISVRLKFLNDTEEVAVVEPQDTVGVLKSKCFSGREHQVKLIYRGQLLQDPKRTLFSLNITDNSVIHCHVSQGVQEAGPEEGAPSGAGSGAGSGVSGGFRAVSVAVSTSSLVVPVFVVILAVVWYFRINYRQFFTAPATISLVGVTVFFSFLIFGMHSR
ncbi:transmembrane and ubiquitin-like domain-containing protein 2 [Kryptolebias marmoratus]|uniref:Transmembrane and ubiquitin-like domain containing 2 n=1 Tax=Kryptolebias marmoratus TaxID=37003 RepID=A0A3Q3AQC4_KRYMA|nr:transmembrane and ubiquitin-like domain-containing protein 2 [Kryptolebias marmoratus]